MFAPNSVKDFESRGALRAANRWAVAFFVVAGASIALVWLFAIYGAYRFFAG